MAVQRDRYAERLTVDANPGRRMTFRHPIRVRYGECDLQGVVFNAHYLAYIDDTIECWLATLADRSWADAWDFMLKAASIEWHGPARVREELVIEAVVQRWGTTSFTVAYAGAVDGRDVFTASVTYVGVEAATTKPARPPDVVVAHLGGA